MYKIIPTDKLEENLLRTFGGRSVSIQPNAAWEDEPFVQEIKEHEGVKEYLDGLVKKKLIVFAEDKAEVKPAEKTLSQYTKDELAKVAEEMGLDWMSWAPGSKTPTNDVMVAKIEEAKANPEKNDGNVEKPLEEMDNVELIELANTKYEAGWDKDEYMEKELDELLELVLGLKAQAEKDD